MKTTIAIIGAGIGGTALLKALFYEENIQIVGIVDVDENAPGIEVAKKKGILVYTSINDFFNREDDLPEFVFNLTGDESISDSLKTKAGNKSTIVVGRMAQFFWELIDQRNQKTIFEEKYKALKKELKENLLGDHLIFGANDQMQQIRDLIKKVAPTPSTVLLTGETGTGKEVIADAIYLNSLLADKEFVKINCTAISSDLLESELFGHKKGAFTGAVNDKVGILERADDGTVFLDEIGDISLQMQVKLLRFLQFGEIRPVGSNETKKVNVRIIAATNRDLQKMIKKEKFRSDLFYRINTISIEIPPLRERKEDISIYAYHFLKKNVKRINKSVMSISSEALEKLIEYDWPGNLRELDSIIERAVILTNSGQIEVEHLTQVVKEEDKSYNFKNGLMQAKKEVVNQFERRAINYYLNDANGNITKASTLARVPRKTFYRLLEKHDVSLPRS